MYQKVYLLSIEDFTEENISGENSGKALRERAFLRVDDARRAKAERMRPGRTQAACLGAGLLLQLAVREAIQRECGDMAAVKTAAPVRKTDRIRIGKDAVQDAEGGKVCGSAFADGADTQGEEKGDLGMNGWERYSAHRLMEEVENGPRLSLAYIYGEKGKPRFRDYPFCFSLSHSGDYVLCALSGQEVGADIQKHQSRSPGKIARRFFAEPEIARLEASGWDEALFFRLWARKEAYGKLTGEGVAGILGMNLLPDGTEDQEREPLPDGQRLVWEERGDIPGYSIAICRYAFPGRSERQEKMN